MSTCNSMLVNEIPSTNEYIKESIDYEKYFLVADKVYQLVDLFVMSTETDLIDKTTNQKYSGTKIGNDLFGDELDGHVHMDVQDAVDLYFDIIRDKINNAPIDESDKNMITIENLKITCEFTRAFGM